MTVLYLIRHGQASFGADEYDQLSALGAHQSRLLGTHLRRTQPGMNAAYSGCLNRHRDTAGHSGLLANGAGPTELEALDEYDYMNVIRAYLPRFVARAARGRNISREELLGNRRLFELAFRFMVRAWMNNESHDHEEFETWQEFCRRVRGGLRIIVESHPPGSRIAVFTSGGVISAALRQVLGLSNKRTLSINWTIYNSSVTQLYYARSARHEDALVLGFNNIAHLEAAGDRALITFR
jgi:broad specificity phosphatase PhoE